MREQRWWPVALIGLMQIGCKSTDEAIMEATTEFAEMYARDIHALEKRIHGFHTTKTDEPTLELEKRFIHLWLQLLDAEIMKR